MVLKKVYNKKRKRMEWAIVSRSKPHRVLQYFGPRKPSYQRFLDAERRIQMFKHMGSSPTRKQRIYKRYKTGKKRGGQRYWIGRKKKATLRKHEFRTFKDLTKRKMEFGGYMDFDRKGLERTLLFHGRPHYIDIPDEDFEVKWHTHPRKKIGIITHELHPEGFSLEDFDIFLNGKEQSAILFQYGRDHLVINKTPATKEKFRKLKNKDLEKIGNRIMDIYEEIDKARDIQEVRDINRKKLDPFLKDKLGLRLMVIPKERSSVTFPIRVVEKKKRKENGRNFKDTGRNFDN